MQVYFPRPLDKKKNCGRRRPRAPRRHRGVWSERANLSERPFLRRSEALRSFLHPVMVLHRPTELGLHTTAPTPSHSGPLRRRWEGKLECHIYLGLWAVSCCWSHLFASFLWPLEFIKLPSDNCVLWLLKALPVIQTDVVLFLFS